MSEPSSNGIPIPKDRAREIEFGKEIRKRRIEYGITQEELAKELKVSYVTVNRWESGKNKIQRKHLIGIKEYFSTRRKAKIRALKKELIELLLSQKKLNRGNKKLLASLIGDKNENDMEVRDSSN